MFMNTENPDWNAFLNKLDDALVIESENDDGEFTTVCDGKNERTAVRKILADMGYDENDIDLSLDWMWTAGGHCSCEVLFNCGVD